MDRELARQNRQQAGARTVLREFDNANLMDPYHQFQRGARCFPEQFRLEELAKRLREYDAPFVDSVPLPNLVFRGISSMSWFAAG